MPKPLLSSTWNGSSRNGAPTVAPLRKLGPGAPLAGRLLGLALALLMLTLVVRFTLGVIAALVSVIVPLIVVLAIYRVMFGGFRK